MLKVNRKSWHYRFNNWCFDNLGTPYIENRRSLCAYFWQTIGNLFLLVTSPIIALMSFPIIKDSWSLYSDFESYYAYPKYSEEKNENGEPKYKEYKLYPYQKIEFVLGSIFFSFLAGFVIVLPMCSIMYLVTLALTGVVGQAILPLSIGGMAVIVVSLAMLIDNIALAKGLLVSFKTKVCPMVAFE